MASTESIAPDDLADDAPPDLAPPPRWLKPVVGIARLKGTARIKLLVGFLAITVLIVALGVLSIGALNRVDAQVETLTALDDQKDRAQAMIYAVSSQVAFRAMALATEIDAWDDLIYVAKDDFASDLTELRATSVPPRDAFFDNLERLNSQFETESLNVSELYYRGDLQRAIDMHIQVEHESSSELEIQLNAFIADSDGLAMAEAEAFEQDRRLLTLAVVAFLVITLGVTLLLGGVLGSLYSDLESLNSGLQETVRRKVEELSRATRLRRYVSPQLADSILAGDTEVTLGSHRKYLTVFLSDIRGFTAMSERMEPEHLVDELNEYLSEMTDIVFRYGGTLDKYIGDAILVFFGDPIPLDDQAQRAVKMALEMQDRVEELSDRWLASYGESFQIGVGITTGWVTVGNIGSPARSDYTVLGNEVNLASRLADLAVAGEILVSERTMMEAEDAAPSAEVVDEVTLKGVSRPIKIYSLSS
jgi:class 3 adenylate cyclase